MAEKFGLNEVTFIQRAVVGPTRADRIPTQDETNAQMDFINRCLSEGRGQLVGTEKGLVIINTSDQQIVMQHTAYHIGFKRKPVWVDDGPKQQAQPTMMDSVLDKF